LHAALLVRDIERDRFERADLSEADARAFADWLNAAVVRQAPEGGDRSGPAKGRSRFIVSFAAAQLDGVRERADRDGVPVAEVIRRAVDAYLAGSEVRPGRADG
jgi:hypothetical protein